ncbi:MAG TPA: APC family permease, partial [Acidimicrobiales bacterium]|nr:APC family permease [Acidimicrobiales bacterium]
TARTDRGAGSSPVSSGPPGAAGGRLRRDVGLIGLTFVSLGSIIGSGWLLGALTAAKAAGPASLVSWVLAGAIIVVLALVHAELGATYPVSGGTARFPHIVFGPFGGFTAGWMAWLGTVTIAPIEVEASLQYLGNKISGLVRMSHGTPILTGPGLAVAFGLMLLFTVINMMGIRWLSETNTWAVWWKLGVPILTIVVLMAVAFHPSNFHAGGGFAPFGVKGILEALPAGVVFSLLGFEQAIQLGGEARDPKRDLPRAIIGAMLIGTAIYFMLEVCFIGALKPANLVHGWGNPIGAGAYGPYATLATGLGLGWLAVILYIDAAISPAGTGLVYVATASRLSYALGRNGYIPRAFDRVGKRGVPYVSILSAFVVGLFVFLPFRGWQQLVGFISSATAVMYAFAPVSLAALRRSDSDRERPYRLPRAGLLTPVGFVAADLIVYWSGWKTDEKLFIAIIAGLAILAIAQWTRTAEQKIALEWRSSMWIWPWLGGMALITWLGQFDGRKVIPFWWDMVLVTALSLAVFYWAVSLALPASRVAANIEAHQDEAGFDAKAEAD